jgi:tRNA(adenine34) deaminase
MRPDKGMSQDPRMHEMHMRRCLALARTAAERGETPVGSLIVRAGLVIAEGIESTGTLLDPTAHAEVQAIRAACLREQSLDLSGCTLYTTVEPCVLCGYAMRRTGLSGLVYGIPAGQLGGCTSQYAIVLDRTVAGWPPPPEIVAGVLADECRERFRAARAARSDGPGPPTG